MNSQLTQKFAAVVIAVTMNGLLLSGMAYLFDTQAAAPAAAAVQAEPASPHVA
jgi:hypothetical protein